MPQTPWLRAMVCLLLLGASAQAALDREAQAHLRTALPRSADRLLAGGEYRVLLLTDRPAGEPLANRLAEALTRMAPEATVRAEAQSIDFPGVTEAARRFDALAAAAKPDLVVLHFALGTQLDEGLEQLAYLARRAMDRDADVLLIAPPPTGHEADHLLTAMAHAAGWARLGEALKLPTVIGVRAFWPHGATSFPAVVEAVTRRIAEKGEPARTLAAAAVERLIENKPGPALELLGRTRWTEAGPVTRLTLTSTADAPVEGELIALPTPGDHWEAPGPVAFELAPGERMSVEGIWRGAAEPVALALPPLDRLLAPGRPVVTAMAVVDGRSHPLWTAASFVPDIQFRRQRTDGVLEQATVAFGDLSAEVPLPADSDAGQLTLIQPTGDEAQPGTAVAHLAYLRFALAVAAEIEPDGDLADWPGRARWRGLAHPVEPLWPRDLAEDAALPNGGWSLLAGEDGLYLGLSAWPGVAGDALHFYIDSRPLDQLGTTGPHRAGRAAFLDGGRLRLTLRDAAQPIAGGRGGWRVTDDGATAELFLPYDALGMAGWPEGGRLGLSLWWAHRRAGRAGQPALPVMWQPEGRPWNPRWFGVVQRARPGADPKPLPFTVWIW